jgi:hypothetical protein
MFRGSRLTKVDWKSAVDETVLALLFVATLSGAVLYIHPDITAGFVTLSPFAIGGGALLAGILMLAAPTLVGHPGRILGASAFLAAVLAFLVAQPAVYAGTAAFEPVWRAALMQFAGYTTLAALFVSAMLLLAAWHASGAVTTTGRGKPPESPPDRLLLVLAALLAAYLLVYFLFTGYVFTGYFARYLSFTIFLNDLVLALGLTAMIDCARGCYDRFRESIGWRRIVLGSATPIAAFGLAGVVVYWGSLQTFLVRKLPPGEISFFPILSTPPFRGSTFAASIYGGTLSYFNKNWAYYDANSALAEGGVTLGPDGYEVKRDDAYVWFADRSVNAAYNKPEYFLAMTFQFWATYGMGAAYLMDSEAVQRPHAGDIPLVRAIREGRTSYLHPVEVARDPSPFDRWSIVRLDWDFPPFLRQLESGEFVTLNASSNGDEIRVSFDYRYAHQEGLPEADTRVTLSVKSRCGPEHDASVPLTPVIGGTREFRLPRSFAGTVRAEVQPATATKVGPAYASRPLQIGSPASCSEHSVMSK